MPQESGRIPVHIICSGERKSNMIIELIPLEKKQPSQIGILQQLAFILVLFVDPGSGLTFLIIIGLELKSTSFARRLILVLLCLNTKKANIYRIVSRKLHPWHVLWPLGSVENCWTRSHNTNKSWSDIGRTCVTSRVVSTPYL